VNSSPQKITEALKMNSSVQFISFWHNIGNGAAENIAEALKMNSYFFCSGVEKQG
jgi:hypothetical protein